jgi:hypothetical protein
MVILAPLCAGAASGKMPGWSLAIPKVPIALPAAGIYESLAIQSWRCHP